MIRTNKIPDFFFHSFLFFCFLSFLFLFRFLYSFSFLFHLFFNSICFCIFSSIFCFEQHVQLNDVWWIWTFGLQTIGTTWWCLNGFAANNKCNLLIFYKFFCFCFRQRVPLADVFMILDVFATNNKRNLVMLADFWSVRFKQHVQLVDVWWFGCLFGLQTMLANLWFCRFVVSLLHTTAATCWC